MKKRNDDGLRYPSIDSLLLKNVSKYELSIAAAKRAKAISADKEYFNDTVICDKPVGQALEEILEDKVSYEFSNKFEDQDE